VVWSGETVSGPATGVSSGLARALFMRSGVQKLRICSGVLVLSSDTTAAPAGVSGPESFAVAEGPVKRLRPMVAAASTAPVACRSRMSVQVPGLHAAAAGEDRRDRYPDSRCSTGSGGADCGNPSPRTGRPAAPSSMPAVPTEALFSRIQTRQAV
jgi:hypothetical protein